MSTNIKFEHISQPFLANALVINTKQHKKRSSQTEAYHKKVQKRWDKRAAKEQKFCRMEPVILSLSSSLYEAIAKVGTRTGMACAGRMGGPMHSLGRMGNDAASADDALYWTHELRAFDNAMAASDKLQELIKS